MNTYLCLLNKDTLFELLVRFHYPDLETLVSAYPQLRLRLVVETTYFRERWNAYNLHVEIKETSDQLEEIVVDRRNVRHGLTKINANNPAMAFIFYEIQYVNDVKHGIEIRMDRNGTISHYRHDDIYSGNLVAQYRSDGRLEQRVTGYSPDGDYDGPVIYNFHNGSVNWWDYRHDGKPAYHVSWHAEGNRSGSWYRLGEGYHGMRTSWFVNGICSKKGKFVDGFKQGIHQLFLYKWSAQKRT